VTSWNSRSASRPLIFAPIRQAIHGVARSRYASVRRRHLPSGLIPLIINFDADVRICRGFSAEWANHRSFTAGLHDVFSISESAGDDSRHQRGLGLTEDPFSDPGPPGHSCRIISMP
jgi:hypothetical protein